MPFIASLIELVPQYPNSIAHGGERAPRVRSYDSGRSYNATRPGPSRRRNFTSKTNRIICPRGTPIAARINQHRRQRLHHQRFQSGARSSIRLIRLYILAGAFVRVENQPDGCQYQLFACVCLRVSKRTSREHPNPSERGASPSIEDVIERGLAIGNIYDLTHATWINIRM